MGGDEDDGGTPTYGGEPPSKFDAGRATELNIEHKATELGTIVVREEQFRPMVSNRLHSRGPQ